MKLEITYTEADLRRLILKDLARQGIPATDADISLKKKVATVVVEVSGDDDAPAQVAPLSHGVNATPPPTPAPTPTPPPPPKLEVIEGSANPVDMTDVLGASKNLARKDGPFHSYLPGESSDFPGVPK